MAGIIGKVLFVDDEPRILQAYQRGLRRRFDIHTATSGPEALRRLEAEGPFPVVVSDMRMPGMSGIELLIQIRARTPDTVRVMLTGNADQQTAIDAVNEGDVFRFLTKPCSVEALARALAAAFRQHRAITAERELLEQTVRGAAEALSEVLSLVDPAAFGRTQRLKRLVRDVAIAMGLAESWEAETAAMLSQIGCVVLPGELLRKITEGAPLTAQERERFEQHPAVGADLLGRIPRLEGVAEIIRFQEKGFDGSGPPPGEVRGEAIPLGARLLKVALDFDRHEGAGLADSEALHALREDGGRYDPKALSGLELMVEARLPEECSLVEVPQLADGMILNEEIRTSRGILVVSRGQEITPSVRSRLLSFCRNGALPERVRISVSMPARGAEGSAAA